MEDEFSWTGADGVRYEGLVDSAEEQEFYNSLEVLCGTWAMGKKELTFFQRFRQKKAAGALKGMYELAGLGSPPTALYTHPTKSMNSALKEKANYTKMQ